MVSDWLVVFVGCVGWAGAACVLCSAYFQRFVYWVGVMFVHVMCTQCVVVWLQRMDVWDFVFMYWLHKAHCHLLPGDGFRSTSPLRSSRATSQPAGCCEAVLLHYIVNVYFLWRPVFTMLYPASNYFLSQFTQRDSWVLRILLNRQMTPH